MPVLNEIDGLRLLLPQIDRSVFDEIIMIDGDSKDGSVEFARENGIKVVPEKREDVAYLIVDALDEIHTEYVIGFSPDGNCKVDDLPKLAAKLREDYDVVSMSRYLDGAKSEDDTPVTAFGNWMFTRMARYLGKYKITDALNMFRGYRVAIMHDPWFRKFMLGPVHEPLLISVANLRGLRIAEIPGDEPPRIGGFRKMRILHNGSFILLLFIRLYLFKIRQLLFPEPEDVGSKETSKAGQMKR